jgi:hypothetical protein
MSLDIESIKKIGNDARLDIKEPLGYCYPASDYIVKKLKHKYNLTDNEVSIKEVRVGKSGTIRHYVVKLHAHCVSEYNSENCNIGSILIDVTLDQYCDSNYDAGDVRTSFGPQNSINDINIYECGNTPYNNI